MEGKMKYKTGNISSSNALVGVLNIPRDQANVNRKNCHHTTKKGVPLVYHTKITVYRANSTDTDELQILKFYTVPQNWVYRNAAVKLHAAREFMFKKNNVSKSERGRYAHTIRYAFDGTDTSDGYSDNWISMVDKDGSAMNYGTWDTTELILNSGIEVRPSLWNGIADQLEDTELNAGNHSLATMYLQSRRLIREDDQDMTNLEGDGAESEFPAQFSIINDLFTHYSPQQDEVREVADDEQDNPPYDADDLTNDAPFIGLIEAGKTMTGLTSMIKDVIYVDIPFGLCRVDGIVQNISSGTRALDFQVEVLGVSEMQG